jgi:hypothetical protein
MRRLGSTCLNGEQQQNGRQHNHDESHHSDQQEHEQETAVATYESAHACRPDARFCALRQAVNRPTPQAT